MATQPSAGPRGRDTGFPTAEHVEAAMALLKTGHTPETVAGVSGLTAEQAHALWGAVLNRETVAAPMS